jgi:hypothetical protein
MDADSEGLDGSREFIQKVKLAKTGHLLALAFISVD